MTAGSFAAHSIPRVHLEVLPVRPGKLAWKSGDPGYNTPGVAAFIWVSKDPRHGSLSRAAGPENPLSHHAMRYWMAGGIDAEALLPMPASRPLI